MKTKVFVDGQHGTTGLQIVEKLRVRAEIDLLELSADDRRNVSARADRLNEAHVAILCLLDDAAKAAVALVQSPTTRIIDASTAHRVTPGWVYGFPELHRGQRDALKAATRIANPGCFAIGAISLLHPVVAAGLFDANGPVSILGLSGYSGGGKDLIAIHEDTEDPEPLAMYGLGLDHKHVPEIMQYGGLNARPLFQPNVGHFAQGMLVSVPFNVSALTSGVTPKQLHDCLATHYAGEAFVSVRPANDEGWLERGRYLRPDRLNGTNRLEIGVYWNDKVGQGQLIARLDNLGKGASGSCVQVLNLISGLPEERA